MNVLEQRISLNMGNMQVSLSGRDIVNLFHQLYYYVDAQTWKNTFWMGVHTLKCPLDMWIYQEILYAVRPELIIETGTFNGGSALFLAHLCDLLNTGQIITVDVEPLPNMPQHPRIRYLKGYSTAPEIVAQIQNAAQGKSSCLVILDSDHTRKNVIEELRLYHRFVTLNSYLIVEDGNVNGHPILPAFGPGPMEAVDEFLKENDAFIVDAQCEKLMMTFNPRGYLKRVK